MPRAASSSSLPPAAGPLPAGGGAGMTGTPPAARPGAAHSGAARPGAGAGAGASVGSERPGLAGLRARIARIEGGGGSGGAAPAAGRVLPLGAPELDAALPGGGLALGRLHEIAATDDGAGAGFAAALLARLMAARAAPVLWCQNLSLSANAPLYGPGFAGFGLAPARLVLVLARNDVETLWVLEEALRCPALGAALGEVGRCDLTATRRLQLAAETGGGTAFLLRPPGAALAPTAAATRWRVGALPGPPAAGVGGAEDARWRAELLRCRGGAPDEWPMEWHHETRRFRVAAAPADGPAGTGRAAPAV